MPAYRRDNGERRSNIDSTNKEIWYHGSPIELTYIRTGSTITQDKDLARIFSHKPSLVCIEDDGKIRHNGALPGYLYRIAEPVLPEAAHPHPRTTMPAGKEWLTTCELKLELICRTEPQLSEVISVEEEAELRRRAASR